ncbi:MAG: aldo/keto reductase [Phycisphaerae bacterium]
MKGTRREFLGQSAMLIASGIVGSTAINKIAEAVSSKTTTQPENSSSPIEKRILGRTGLKISVISVGSIGTTQNVVRYAIDNGINFFHTALNYNSGKAITEVGKALKGAKKDSLHVGLKVTWNWKTDDDLAKSLKILGRDYVDILFFNIHSNPKLVASPEAKETFERWKKQGKVRFMGLTTHGGMKECMESALATGWYDCLMPTYTLDLRDSYADIFKKCQQQKVGFIAMKTNLSEDNANQTIPVMLKDKPVTTLCKSLRSLSSVKKYIEASKEKVTDADAVTILKLAALTNLGRCHMCGTCNGVCENGLAVSDMIRCVDYYVDAANDYETGKTTYAALGSERDASRCTNCGQCENACPNKVPVRHLVKRAREIFV